MSLQQDLILCLPHFALKQFLPEFVATWRCLAHRNLYMYVCMYIYRNCKNLSLFSSRMATSQTQFKRERRHGLTSTSLQLDQQAGKLKMFGKFQQSASSSISYPCHVLYQVCVYFIPGGRLETREKLWLCRDTYDNIYQYTSDTQHIWKNVFSAYQIRKEIGRHGKSETFSYVYFQCP